LASKLVALPLPRHTNPLTIRTALHAALHSLRQCQWHSVTCTAVRLTATQLKPLLVRLYVHLDCDQCGRIPLAARVLQFRPAVVCLRYNNRTNKSVNWPAREADHSLPKSTEVTNDYSYTSTPLYVFMAAKWQLYHLFALPFSAKCQHSPPAFCTNSCKPEATCQ
jgi:hypothetical protein